MIGEKIKRFIQNNLLYSFNSTINFFYITLIILFVLIIGSVSFYIATKQVEENTYENVNDTVLQTTNYLDFLLTDVFEQLVSLSNDPMISTLIHADSEDISPKIYIDMDAELRKINHRFNMIIDSILVDIDHGRYSFYRAAQKELSPSFSYQDYFSKYQGSKESFYWRNIHQDETSTIRNEVISVFKLFGNERSESRGLIQFNLKADFFKDILDTPLIGENGYLTLVGANSYYSTFNHAMFPNYLTHEAIAYLNETDTESGQFSFESEEGTMIVIYNTVSVNNWKVAAVLPENEIVEKLNYIKSFTVAFLVFIIFIAILAVNQVGKFITKPIKQLANYISVANPDNILDVQNDLATPKEMKILYQSFNEQMLRNKKLLEQIKIDQEARRQLEVAIIQAQIDPHFLYNTLYSIKGLSDMGLNEEASEMISALSNFYRISISQGNEIISIAKEIEHIKNYLYIMEMRYGDQFTYEIDVEKEILANSIIKLTLQPLVENAIYHGVKQKREPGFIQLKGFQIDEKIFLEVIDNGLGIEKVKLNHIIEELETPYNERKIREIGIGLKSVKERVRVHYGKEYGLFIESKINQGTKVTVIIPKVKERGY